MAEILHLCDSNEQTIVSKIANAVQNNRAVIIPTDTIYGFFAPFNNKILENKIRKIKIRDDKPFIHLVSSTQELCSYSQTKIPSFILNALPAPLTLIVESQIIQSPIGSVAFRFPPFHFLVALIKSIGVPCVSTSANISGEPMPDSTDGIIELFKNEVDMIVTGQKPGILPSTILDIREKPYQCVRKGEFIIPNEWMK